MSLHDEPLQPRSTLTDRGRGLLVAGSLLAITGMALGFVDLVRVGALVLALPLVALLGSRRRWAALTVHRWVDGPPVTAGVPAVVTVRITNDGASSTPVLLAEDHLSAGLATPTAGGSADLPATASVRFVSAPIPPGASRAFGYPVQPLRRGRHRIGPLILTRRDPLGLTTAAIGVQDQLEILALPSIHPLAGAVGAVGIGSDGSTPAMSVLHGDDDTSIRGYHDGDDVRRIHWPVTAHRGQLMVRHEGRPTSRRALLLVDPAVLAVGPGPAQPVLDWAVAAIASVAAHLAAAGFALHPVTPASVAAATTDAPVPLARLVSDLALVEPETDAEAFAHPGRPALLSTLRELAARGGLLVAAVGDHHEPGLHQVLETRPPGGAGLLFVLDSASFLDGHADSRATELAALARARGWIATPVTGGDDVGAAWARLVQVQAAGMVVS